MLSDKVIFAAVDALVSLGIAQCWYRHIARRLISIIYRSNHHISFDVINPMSKSEVTGKIPARTARELQGLYG